MEGDDARVQALEDRLSTLEQTVQAHHTQQTIQNQQVATQVGGIQQQLAEQSTALHKHMDTMMSEQLRHIEQLLKNGKHSRGE